MSLGTISATLMHASMVQSAESAWTFLYITYIYMYIRKQAHKQIVKKKSIIAFLTNINK